MQTTALVMISAFVKVNNNFDDLMQEAKLQLHKSGGGEGIFYSKKWCTRIEKPSCSDNVTLTADPK